MEKTTMWESTAIEKSAVKEKPKDVQYQGEQPEGTIHLEKYKVAGFFIAYFFLGMIFFFIVCYGAVGLFYAAAHGRCDSFSYRPHIALNVIGFTFGNYFGLFLHTIWFGAGWEHFKKNASFMFPVDSWLGKANLDHPHNTWKKKTLLYIPVVLHIAAHRFASQRIINYTELAFCPCGTESRS
ncbi:uncharacterized protein RCO7_04732 [Rhynchosporium graminicola]|uniref:Uncharacterized protein n=1 Tax=Rhynchosporium graminicola TaxID=2792576 RepID=A0A1E1JTS6_9HELO|nr:uncharacterized protein RCO7_04732 [Rhynchosporium commune]